MASFDEWVLGVAQGLCPPPSREVMEFIMKRFVEEEFTEEAHIATFVSSDGHPMDSLI